MSNQNNTKALVETALLTALAVVLILITTYVPVLGIICTFIWPLPIAMVYIRHGVKNSVLSLAVTGIIAGMMVGPIVALGLVTSLGLTGVILGYCISKKKPSSFTLIAITIVTFISSLITIKLYSIVAGQDIVRQTINEFMQTVDMVKNLYASAGIPQETIDQAMKVLPTADFFVMLMPSVFVMYSLFSSFISYVVAQLIFKKFKVEMDHIRSLDQWYIPSSVVTVLSILMIVALLMPYIGMKNSQAYTLNVFMMFQLAFSINGFGLLSFFLKKKNVAKVLRIVIYCLIFVSPLMNAMFIAGIFDYAINYRKLDKTRIKRV